MRIYFAAPLFTAPERYSNADICSQIPGLAPRGMVATRAHPETTTSFPILAMLLKAMLESDVIVAKMDGPGPDSRPARWRTAVAL